MLIRSHGPSRALHWRFFIECKRNYSTNRIPLSIPLYVSASEIPFPPGQKLWLMKKRQEI
ncbi:unnamed protein product, partial [Nesidiocoris tenuis]